MACAIWILVVRGPKRNMVGSYGVVAVEESYESAMSRPKSLSVALHLCSERARGSVVFRWPV